MIGLFSALVNPPSQQIPEYQQPFSWWGSQWLPHDPKSLPWLIQAQTISVQTAAFLSLAIELRRSIVILAAPDQAGKTTLLTALLDFIPNTVQPVYTRGLYERFEFVHEHTPDSSYVLCNEISAHLPTYLWGRGVRMLFDALPLGFRFATTMHAASATDAIDQLTRYPLDVPVEQVGLLDITVTLDMGTVDNRLVRRVSNVDRIDSRNGQIVTETLSKRHPRLRSTEERHIGRMVRAIADWTDASDDTAARLLSRRERFLAGCIRQETIAPPAVRTAIFNSREREDD